MILVRHGESEFNVRFAKTRKDPGIRDPELTPLGRKQIAEAARHIAEGPHSERISTILASPYTRTLQSAEILARDLGLPVHVDPLVGEHAHFTCDIGTPRADLATRWPSIAFDHLEEEWWPEQEGDDDVGRRAQAFRSHMAERDDWEQVLVVTHWGFIRGLTGHRVPNAAVLTFDPLAPHPEGADVIHPPGMAQMSLDIASPPAT